jgi:ketosteroid isomerase-like protein
MQARWFIFVLAMAAGVPLAAQAAPRVATALSSTELAELEWVRKQVWVDWFAGDTAALGRVLGPELVAIGPDAPHWQSRAEALAASARFKESGGRLLGVTFDSTVVHRIGDVAVMFSLYDLRTSRLGEVVTRSGKVTEVFVRRRGRWVHTSWHIDTTVSSTGA